MVIFLLESFLLWLYFCLSSFFCGYISVCALSIVGKCFCFELFLLCLYFGWYSFYFGYIFVGALLMVVIYVLFFFL